MLFVMLIFIEQQEEAIDTRIFYKAKPSEKKLNNKIVRILNMCWPDTRPLDELKFNFLETKRRIMKKYLSFFGLLSHVESFFSQLQHEKLKHAVLTRLNSLLFSRLCDVTQLKYTEIFYFNSKMKQIIMKI